MPLLSAGSALHSSAGNIFDRGLADPTRIDPLPNYHRHGLIAVSSFALLSAVATLSMFTFMTIRLVFWKRFGNTYPGYNQYIILIYNLLIADLIQSCAFSLNLYWIAHNKIVSPSAVCTVQGLFVQLGDPGSGLFALAIAAHTFMQAVFGRKIEYRWFITSILCIWGFMAVMCIIPIASHWNNPNPVFAPTGAWCWLNNKYEKDRLWTHYFWIFIAEFCTLVLYGIIFIQLRRKIASSKVLGNRNSHSLTRLTRITNLMVMYPIAYVVLSLPLAIGRMSTEHGRQPSVTYFCVAGSMITSSGFCDVLMYTFTRRALTVEHHHHHHRHERSPSAHAAAAVSSGLNPFHHHDYRSNHIATVVALTTFVPSPPSSSSSSPPPPPSAATTQKRKRGNGIFSVFHNRIMSLRHFFNSPSSPSVTSSSKKNKKNESCESIVPTKQQRQDNNLESTDLSCVYRETTIEITSEPAYPRNNNGAHNAVDGERSSKSFEY